MQYGEAQYKRPSKTTNRFLQIEFMQIELAQFNWINCFEYEFGIRTSYNNTIIMQTWEKNLKSDKFFKFRPKQENIRECRILKNL